MLIASVGVVAERRFVGTVLRDSGDRRPLLERNTVRWLLPHEDLIELAEVVDMVLVKCFPSQSDGVECWLEDRTTNLKHWTIFATLYWGIRDKVNAIPG